MSGHNETHEMCTKKCISPVLGHQSSTRQSNGHIVSGGKDAKKHNYHEGCDVEETVLSDVDVSLQGKPGSPAQKMNFQSQDQEINNTKHPNVFKVNDSDESLKDTTVPLERNQNSKRNKQSVIPIAFEENNFGDHADAMLTSSNMNRYRSNSSLDEQMKPKDVWHDSESNKVMELMYRKENAQNMLPDECENDNIQADACRSGQIGEECKESENDNLYNPVAIDSDERSRIRQPFALKLSNLPLCFVNRLCIHHRQQQKIISQKFPFWESNDGEQEKRND
ncbi:hypothetical protein PoB_000018400 [Plakobranchus ocellatus]|uniref:Uncharacterized protein n=1 Tax=Plakobranchus ocellatus TaxID=259542 RepID=A0AAV3XQB4_9GAST|nr:hypothetical protein PoB_000018400 [Plakobranchus ocellatus]